MVPAGMMAPAALTALAPAALMAPMTPAG